MSIAGAREHWESVYLKKNPLEVSWYQPTPMISLQLIEEFLPDKELPLIDIGAGASTLMDHLLKKGYSSLSALDVARKALEHSQKRLGKEGDSIDWIVADITEFQPSKRYSLWHDRAVFHFLTDLQDRLAYRNALLRGTSPGSVAIMAAFAIGGPEKCSGLDVVQYDRHKMQEALGDLFSFEKEIFETHITPAGKDQSFGYFVFRRTA